MACPCCNPQISCANQCNGNGVPSQIAMQITGVSFGANSEFDASDLEFDVPSTFILPLLDPQSGCRLWGASFLPRTTLCRECGTTGGFGAISGLGISVGRQALDLDQLNVSIGIAFGEANASGNCLGASGFFIASSIGNICALPLSGTATTQNSVCAATNISSVAFTLEAA